MSCALKANEYTTTRFTKTRLCNFNMRGKCERGEACKFAHNVQELSPMPDLYRTRLCTSIVKLGMCKNGDQCQYAHSREELRDPVEPMQGLHPMSERPATIRELEEGQESMSKAAKAPLLKVDMCKFFQQGRCLRGESCTFAHHEDELQERPNFFRTMPCFRFAKEGKCTEDCKYYHSVETVRKGAYKKTEDFDSSGIFSRQTTADLDSNPLWSRQTSHAITEYSTLSTLSQDFDESLIQYLQNTEYSTSANSQDFDEIAEEGSDDLSNHGSTEYFQKSASSEDTLEDDNEDISQEMIDNECARLQEISKLNDLKITLKNTFLAFEERDMSTGSAACRARSA